MAALTGKAGTVKVGTTYFVKDVRSWTANLDCDDVDITSMDSGGAKEFAPGLTGATFDVDCVLQSDQDLTILALGAQATVALRSVAVGTNAFKVSATAYVKSVKPKVDYKGEVSAAVTFQATGTITVAYGA